MTSDRYDIKTLVESIYELAGLVELSATLSPPENLPELLRRRLDMIESECMELSENFKSRQDSSAAPSAECDLIPASDDSDDGCYVIEDDLPDLDVSPASTETPAATEAVPEVYPDLQPAARPPMDPVAQNPRDPKKASRVFTLNDRFFFTRQLFGGKRNSFDHAMIALAGMDSYEEAEDYFIYQLGWDADNEDVKKFFAIVAGIF